MIRPWLIECEITGACNLRCAHCYARGGEEPKKRIPAEKLKQVMKDLHGLGLHFFDLVGGEPLLHPEIYEILSYAYSIGQGVILNTNATLVDGETAKRLRDANPRIKIGVSLDGPNESINDRVRGRGSFKKALHGVECLLAEGLSVTFQCVLNKLNWKWFEQYIQLAKQVGVGSIYVDRLIPIGRASQNRHDLDMSVSEWAKALVEVNKIIDSYWDEMVFYVEESVSGADCRASIDHFSITWDGIVVPCGHFRYDERFHLGSIYDQDVAHILSRAKAIKPTDPSCSNCPLAGNQCAAGCPASSYAYRGNHAVRDPVICGMQKLCHLHETSSTR